jgi:hypothetical protein
MKKILSLTLALIIVMLTACSSNTVSDNAQKQQSSGQNENNSAVSHNNSGSDGSTVTKEGANAVEKAKIRLTFNNQEIVMNMYDNPTSRDLLKLLPLTLKFEDYSGAEKIGHLPKALTTHGSPSGSDPSVGDVAFYAPWRNLALYYNDVGYYDGIIRLGHTNPSEMKKLKNIKGDFNVRIERVD